MRISPWRLTGWICVGVIVASVASCVLLAALRSNGLTAVKVTALDGFPEPRDHQLPLIKQKEALPDYELFLMLHNGRRVHLGAKPDTSAARGVVWQVADPVSLADISAVRLREQDQLLSDALAEVHITGPTTTAVGYRFDFSSERSLSVGIQSFFATPIGLAIAAGFTIAVVLLLVRAFAT